jgi:transcriptional regulator NrdR family protein
MSKLKVLTQDDLATISDDFGEILEQEVSKALPSKEIEDLDLDIVLSYEDNQLDVDVDVGVSFDELSEITQDQVANAIDEAYVRFDSYIDDLEDKAELTVYLSHTTLESDDTTEGNERYILSMDSPTKINYLNHSITHWTVTKSGKRSREDIRTVIYENRYVNR